MSNEIMAWADYFDAEFVTFLLLIGLAVVARVFTHPKGGDQ